MSSPTRHIRRTRDRARAWTAALLSALGVFGAEAAQAADWRDDLKKEVERIDAANPGEFGMFVKRLADGQTYSYRGDERWYLGSTVKVPVAISLLQEVEAGHLRLDKQLRLADTDKIDGSGNLVWQKSGSAYRVDALLKRMLMDSDNTAANMLVHAIGIDTVNERSRAFLGKGSFERFTDFAAIRYDVYAELNDGVRKLPNIELVKLAGAPMGPQRVDMLRRMLSIERSALAVPTMAAAYDRYYQRDLNSATLVAYGGMLEGLVTGKLLSPEHTRLMFTDLKYDTYDAYRLEAGLPRSVRFIHKTGTQYERACHMGVIEPQDGARNAVVVATCASGLDEHDAAGRLFEQLGRAITRTMLRPNGAR